MLKVKRINSTSRVKAHIPVVSECGSVGTHYIIEKQLQIVLKVMKFSSQILLTLNWKSR